jgi:4-aminobutyrate aminotransferase-like enzyme
MGVRERIRRYEGGGMRTWSDPEPLVWARTAGDRVWDEDGHEYLDLYAGFAVAALGYCHPRVTEAIRVQAGEMTHCPSAHPSRVRAELYERLARIAPEPLQRFLLAVTGSLANELAIALARAYTGRNAIVSFSGAYLGRSAGAVPFAGKQAYREPAGVPAAAHFLPFPDPYRSPWAGDREPGKTVLELLETALTDPASGVDPVAAVVVEPVQGNGGVVVPPDGFLAGVRELCDRTGTLLVFDEIQSGFGRTGRMWACEHWAVVPDLMTAGKGIGGGLALAAVFGREDVMSTWGPDATTSTFLTNALNEAAGVAAIDALLDERLVERSAELGARLLARLRADVADASCVGHVRGVGLFAGIEIVADRATREPDGVRAHDLQRELRRRGVLVGLGGRYGNVLKLSPPLVVDEGRLFEGLATIAEVLR